MSTIDEVEIGDTFYVPVYNHRGEVHYLRQLTVASTPATMVRLVADDNEHVQYRAMRNKQDRAPDGCLVARQAGADSYEVTLYDEWHSKLQGFQDEVRQVRARTGAYVLVREAQGLLLLGSTGDVPAAQSKLRAALKALQVYWPEENES